MRLAKSDYRWRRMLGHRLLRASGNPIVCRGLRSCQCRIGQSYLCLDQEGGGLSHGRGLRGCWRAVVGDTACEGGVYHRTATGLGWHEICHLENGFDGMSKATNDNVLGRGPSRQSSNLRRWICDINFSAVFPPSPSLGMPSQLQQSRTSITPALHLQNTHRTGHNAPREPYHSLHVPKSPPPGTSSKPSSRNDSPRNNHPRLPSLNGRQVLRPPLHARVYRDGRGLGRTLHRLFQWAMLARQTSSHAPGPGP